MAFNTRTVVTALLISSTFVVFSVSWARAQSETHSILITGSNRGIGLEFTRQYASKGWQVIATCRHPETAGDLKQLAAEYSNIVIERLDVLDYDQIDTLAAKYRDRRIDILLNNAAITGGSKSQRFGTLEYATFERVLATNVIGPLKMAEAFFDQVARSNQKKIVNITSEVGSIAKVSKGGLYFYRPSKAALNMAMKILSVDAGRRGVIVGLINPGMVATRMLEGANPKMSSRPIFSAEESVSDMIRVISNLTPAQSGIFLDKEGAELPW